MRSLLKAVVNKPLSAFGLKIARLHQAPALPEPAPPQPKTWAGSQRYELDHAIQFMQEPYFAALYESFRSGRLKASLGHRDPLLMREFFADSEEEFRSFIGHISGRACLDIGPCVSSFIAAWDTAGARYVVEPLFEPINAWQSTNLGKSIYEGLTAYATPGEEIIPELVRAIDGAIVCRNTLDHTPQWPFILANISRYAAAGCRLLLWADLDHRGTADAGHYDITRNVSAFRNLVILLGFRILREYSDTERFELNWGCFAEKAHSFGSAEGAAA